MREKIKEREKMKRRQKIKRIWSLLGGAAFLFGACSSEGYLPQTEDRLPQTQDQIRFTVSPVMQADAESRAVLDGEYLSAGDAVGIFAYSYPPGSPGWDPGPGPGGAIICDNQRGTAGTAPQDGSGQSITLPGDEYYTLGYTHAFYSYYPYRSALSTNSPVLNADLFTTLEADGTQIDWLWAEPQTGVLPSSTPVALAYSHLMTMVKIAVARSVATNELNITSVTLGTSSSQRFTFDVTSGVVSRVAGGATKFTQSFAEPFAVPVVDGQTPATGIVAQVLLLPSSRVTSLSLVMDNGEVYTTSNDWAGFMTSASGGKYKQMSIVFGVSAITIRLSGGDWVDDPEIPAIIKTEDD